jgi:hypothetical protein
VFGGDVAAIKVDSMEQRPDRSEGVKAVAAVFMSVATVAVFLRVYCRLKLVKNFGWDDGLMVMAMVGPAFFLTATCFAKGITSSVISCFRHA